MAHFWGLIYYAYLASWLIGWFVCWLIGLLRSTREVIGFVLGILIYYDLNRISYESIGILLGAGPRESPNKVQV